MSSVLLGSVSRGIAETLTANISCADPEVATLLLICVLDAENDGHTYVPVAPLDAFLSALRKTCKEHELSTPADLRKRVKASLSQIDLAGIIGPPGSDAPLILHTPYLQRNVTFHREETLLGGLKQHLPSTPTPSQPHESSLTEEQNRAVTLASTQRFSILSGGPGTGKSKTIIAIVEQFLETGLSPEEIAVAAPTGKAAQHLASLIPTEITPQTLHRLLEFTPQGGFGRHRQRPLKHKRILIDEASMLDLELCAALWDACADDALMCWVGDAEQLPPVGPGGHFQKLVRHWPHATRLTKNFRTIASAAHLQNAISCIQSGDFPQETGPSFARSPIEELPHYIRTSLASLPELPIPRQKDDCHDLLQEYFSYRSKQQILTAMRHGEHGSLRINQICLEYSGHRIPTHGTPILITENSPNLGLYNGDSGVILEIQRDNTSQVFAGFWKNDAPLLVHFHSIQGLFELAYAITVHKSQGSEYDEVGIILPRDFNPVCERALLYTGVTRARHKAVVFADEGILRQTLANVPTRSVRPFSD